MNEFKKRVIVGQLEIVTSQIIQEAKSYNGEESSELIKKAYKVIDDSNMLSTDNSDEVEIIGDADDFHNLAVTFVNIDDYETALDIIKKGLEIHKSNTDLLADAIKFGSVCGEYSKCDEWCANLNNIIKQRWTWRAFSFMIDYIIESLDRKENITEENFNSEKEKALKLLKEYQEIFYDNEDAWYSEFEIHWQLNERRKAKEILEKLAFEEPILPKAVHRYADILVDEKKFNKAEEVLYRLVQSTDGSAYAYYLYGICQLERLLKIINKNEIDEITYSNIQDAYRSFNNAWEQNRNSRLERRIQIAVQRLYSEFKIYPLDKYNIKEWAI